MLVLEAELEFVIEVEADVDDRGVEVDPAGKEERVGVLVPAAPDVVLTEELVATMATLAAGGAEPEDALDVLTVVAGADVEEDELEMLLSGVDTEPPELDEELPSGAGELDTIDITLVELLLLGVEVALEDELLSCPDELDIVEAPLVELLLTVVDVDPLRLERALLDDAGALDVVEMTLVELLFIGVTEAVDGVLVVMPVDKSSGDVGWLTEGSVVKAVDEELGIEDTETELEIVLGVREEVGIVEELELTGEVEDEELVLWAGMFTVCPTCRLFQSSPGFAALRASKVHPDLSAIAQPKSPATTVYVCVGAGELSVLLVDVDLDAVVLVMLPVVVMVEFKDAMVVLLLVAGKADALEDDVDKPLLVVKLDAEVGIRRVVVLEDREVEAGVDDEVEATAVAEEAVVVLGAVGVLELFNMVLLDVVGLDVVGDMLEELMLTLEEFEKDDIEVLEVEDDGGEVDVV